MPVNDTPLEKQIADSYIQNIIGQSSVNTPSGITVQPLSTQGQFNLNEQNNASRINYNQAVTDSLNLNTKRLEEYYNSPIGIVDPYIKGGTAIIGGVASLASIYTGFETLKLQKKADERADEIWAYQKEELSRVKNVREKNDAKMASMQTDPNSMYYSK